MPEEGNGVHLVHHDSDVLLTLYDVLSAAGFRVSASTDAHHALAFIARSRPRAVLYHREMPEVDGAQFIARLRPLAPETRVVLSSTRADGAMYDDVLGQGGSDLLREPFHPMAVVHVVSRMLGFSVSYMASDAAASFRAGAGAAGGGECHGR